MYLGSGTNDTLQKVLLARLSTDSKFTEVTIWEPVEINAQLLSTKFMLKDHISVHREQATSQPMTIDHNLNFYTNITLNLLNALVNSVQVPPEDDFWKLYISYDSILRAGDAAGIQRALGSAFYASCWLSKEHQEWFMTLENLAQSYLDESYRFLPVTKQWYGEKNGELVRKKEEIVGSPEDATCYEASEADRTQMGFIWFDNMTTYLGHLGGIRQRIQTMMIEQLNDTYQVSRPQVISSRV